MNDPIPAWASELKQRYLKGEASSFIVHGNVHDLILCDGQQLQVSEFLTRVLLAPSKDVIAVYNLSSGVRFTQRKTSVLGIDQLITERSVDKVLPALEQMLLTVDRTAVVIEFAEMIAPVGDANFFSESDRQSVITLQRWSMSPEIAQADSLVILMTENLAELNPKLVANPRIVTLQIPMPDNVQRANLIRVVNPQLDAAWVTRLSEVTAGLRQIQIKAILQPPADAAQDSAARHAYIARLLEGSPDAEDRAKKLAGLTQGMGLAEIRQLVNPTAPDTVRSSEEARAEVLNLIYQRKREIIERECFGLIEFISPTHDFSAVGGIDEIKKDLLTIAYNIREGKRERCPMGMLFTGPMGTGKTFVAEAFVKETGLTAIKLKNFRSKWVGATEGNLDKILSVIQAIGQVVVIIDEGDRAFGGGGEEDGGTSSRVIGRIKEFMSDTDNRGRILFIVMTNRPDKLDVDLKRAGRLDRKIPFLYPQKAEEVEGVLTAQFRRHRIATDLTFPQDRNLISAKMVGYSNAEIEAVVLLANDYAQDHPVTLAEFKSALEDYLPSRDDEMLEYMELLAVFEASNRRMLPEKYRAVPVEELRRRMVALRAQVGQRR